MSASVSLAGEGGRQAAMITFDSQLELEDQNAVGYNEELA